MKRNKMMLIIFLSLIFVVQFSLNPVVAELKISGTFYGFNWEYGEETRNFSKSVAYSNSFSESESNTKTKSYTIDVPLRTGLEIQDILWERWTNRSKVAPNSSWELPGSPQNWLGYRADGYLTNKSGQGGAWFRFIGVTVTGWGPGWQAANYPWFGRQIDVGLAEIVDFPTPRTWQTSYTNLTVVGTKSVPMKDWLGIIHDYTDIESYKITYSYDNGTLADPSDDEVVFAELLIPRFVLVKVETTKYTVNVDETAKVAASLSGQFNFSGTWVENLLGQHVSVKDGSNYWFDYFALISGNVDYDYEGGFTLEGYLSSNLTREVEFTNGSDVPESIRPFWLQSLRIRLEGKWDHYADESGILYGQGAIQSMIQVLLTKASTNQSPNLAVWGNFNPGRIIGYKDVDGDGILTAFLSESQIATPDALMAVGFPEGAHLEGTYYARAFADADVFMSLGDWVIADNASSVTLTIDKPIDETWGYDPRKPDSGPTDVSLDWSNPTESGGKATFKWKTTYSDMPMTWWAKNDTLERIITDNTDIIYGYSLIIDPVSGEAILESTYQQSEIEDTQLKHMMNSQQMSMATYRRDYYLSMTQINADMSGSFARPESQFDMSVAGEDLFSQNFGGAKEDYYLQNNPTTLYKSGTSILNLLTAEGFSGEPTNQTARNPYSSPISKRLAVALTHWSADTHTKDISWIFRENLVITSYPTWNGEGITHDPAYTAHYAGTASRETESTDKPQTSTTKEGVPGFGIGGVLVLLTVIKFVKNKRKRP